MLYCRPDGAGTRLKVHLTPRASQDRILGLHEDALKVKVKAPAVEGRANEALLKFLARVLGLSRSDLEIGSGRRSRIKTVRINGVSPEEVLARMGLGGDLNRK
ncbi:MAG: DUF167 domain-containing protein [Pseudomonadota bacterium]